MKPFSSFWPLANKLFAALMSVGIGFWGVALILGGISTARSKRNPQPAPVITITSSAPAAEQVSSPIPATAALADAVPSPELQAKIESGQKTYMTVCIACHQPTGAGLPGMFPTLIGTDWVTAPKPDRMIRIVLHGLMGPMSINGQPFTTPAPMMPPQGGMLNDSQIADVLTFVRQSWGNKASEVKATEVAAIREAEKSRTAMWTEAELLKIADR